MQALTHMLEAGLLDHNVHAGELDSFHHALGNLSLAEIGSDCCSSNNYPTPPQPPQ
jgi:hypothetical protein